MMKLAAVDPLTALIMGGTDNPLPDPAYVTAINNAYIQPRFPELCRKACSRPSSSGRLPAP